MLNASPSALVARVRVQHGTLEEQTDLFTEKADQRAGSQHGFYRIHLSNGAEVNVFWREVAVDADSTDVYLSIIHGRDGR